MNAVPASRADIFRDKTLSLSDKRFLMRFFKLVTDYTENGDGELAAEDLDRPFVELLRRQQLPISIQEYVDSAFSLVINSRTLLLLYVSDEMWRSLCFSQAGYVKAEWESFLF